MNAQFNRTTLIKVLVAALLVGGVFWWWNWADLFASSAITLAHKSFFLVGPVAGILALCGIGGFLLLPGRNKPEYRMRMYNETLEERTQREATAARYEQTQRTKNIAAAVLFVVAVVAFGFTIKFWVTHGYNVDKAYTDSITIVEETSPNFEERVAYQVAKSSANNNLRDITGDLQNVRYIADNQTWNALTHRRTRWYEGSYEVVQQQRLSLAGSAAEVSFCHFDTSKATRRLGGFFYSSLERSIAHQARGTTFDMGDAYGICTGVDQDHPVVVVPLKKVKGWLHAYEVPAGVAVYDGLTGELKILDEVKPGQLAGPVYPMSLAKRTREAAVSLGTWSERKRTGFDETTDGGNRSEFSLKQVDGNGVYTTPLTPRGDSESITALGVVAADRMVAGQHNALTVYKFADPRVSNTTMEKNTRGGYGTLEWAAGLELYEIAPVSESEWVASLGMEQKILYRVRIQANGESCLETADGTKLRCSNDAASPTTDPSNPTTSPVEVPAGSEKLRELTDEQLVELQEQVTREVLRRVNSTK